MTINQLIEKIERNFHFQPTEYGMVDLPDGEHLYRLTLPDTVPAAFINEMNIYLQSWPTRGGGRIAPRIYELLEEEWSIFFSTLGSITRTNAMPTTSFALPTMSWKGEDFRIAKNTCSMCKIEKNDEFFYVRENTYCRSCFKKNYFLCEACQGGELKKKTTECDVCLLKICSNCKVVHGCFKLPAKKKEERREIYKLAKENNIPHYSLKSPHREYQNAFISGTTNNTNYINHSRFVGIEIEGEGGDSFGLNVLLPKSVGISRDGSLNQTGIEVQTPPASGDALEKIVSDVCKTMHKKEYKGTIACGLHVHIDATGFRKSKEKLSNIIKTFYAIEDMIFSFIPPSRWVSHYCQRLCKDYSYNNFDPSKGFDESWYKEDDRALLRIRKTRKYDKARYYGLNMHSVTLNGTIELRYHSGTINARRILLWVSFCLYVVEYALKNYSEKEIKCLFDMETGWEKFEKMCGVFNLPIQLRNYLETRINKFNPDFNIKFNKGKEVRKKERRIYNKVNEMMQEKIKELRPGVISEITAEFKANGISNPAERRSREFFKAIEDRLDQKLKMLFPQEYKIIPADGGFILDKEIENILKFITQGQQLQQTIEDGEIEI